MRCLLGEKRFATGQVVKSIHGKCVMNTLQIQLSEWNLS